MKFRIALAAVALLVFGMSGVASAQSDTGTLIFDHNIVPGPDVDLTVVPDASLGADDVPVGVVLAGDSISQALPAGTHTLVVDIADLDIVAETAFVIEVGATTTVTAYLEGEAPALDVSDPVADEDDDDDDGDDETSTPEPETVTVPSRVDTGAGGSTDAARDLVLGGLAAATVLGGALTFGLRRRSAA